MRPLTLSQYRAAALMVNGLKDREIAEAMECSESMVQNHLCEAFSRLGLAQPGRHKGHSLTKRILLAAWWMTHQFKSAEEFFEYQRIGAYSAHLQSIWNDVKSPIKFPAPSRRRRSDREIPKAA